MVENKENINQEEEQQNSVPMWLMITAIIGAVFGLLGSVAGA